LWPLLFGCRPRRLGSFEARQERPEQLVKGALLGQVERGEELLLVGEVDREQSVDRDLAAAGQPDEGASAVVGVWSSLDQAGVGETVEPLGHAAGGQHHRPHQLRGLQRIGFTGAPQGGEQVEPAGLEPLGRELLAENGVGEMDGPEQARQHRQRGHVEIGPLPPPPLDDPVHVIGHRLDTIHSARMLPREILTGEDLPLRAIRLHPPGRLDDLRLDEVEAPQPRPGQALVRVHAAALTRDELTWPADRLPAIPSYELSGVLAEDSDGFSAGAEVFALTPFDRDGVAADYALVPTEVLAPKPRSLSHVQAAALPMPWLSAWQALIVHGRLQPGERVAVTGAHGGVGHVAVQLARSQGATLVEAGEPCDLLFDTTGGEPLARSAGQAGRIVTVAAETPGAHYFIVEPNREQLLQVARLVDSGELRPEIDSIFPLAEARSAFARSAARGKHGKVVLQVTD
jgi:NADPH:quinone reductase-like Zn-dependent oxidoreductase